MTDEGNRGRELELGKRIQSRIRSLTDAPAKQTSQKDLQKLKAAAGRLDQMLKDAADADRQALKDAAGRLDRLLADIRKGKKTANQPNRRGDQRED